MIFKLLYEYMKDIYEYLDYRTYLRDFQLDRQSRNPAFSVRSFLKRAGIASPSFFKQIVQGDRNLTERTLQQFLTAMNLKSRESDYFRSLVHFNQAKSAEEKQLHYSRLRELGTEAKVRIVGEDSYAYYEHWYTSVLRELVCLKPFHDDYATLAKWVQPAITATEARQSVKLLLQLGFIEPAVNGLYKQSSPLLHTGFEVQSIAVRQFNKQMVQLAAESLDRFPQGERSITGVTLSTSERTYNLIQEEIRAFQDRILKLAEEDSDTNRVMQLNVMLFPLSQALNNGGNHDA